MKAVSPLIATALLLIITVAGGIIIYNYVVNSLSSAQQYASLSIVSSRMVVLENSTVINVKITNIGTAPTTINEIEILPLNITKKLNIPIDPGTTKSINIFLDQRLDTSIKHYIIVKYDDGETEPHLIEIVK